MPGLVESHIRALQVFVALHGGTGDLFALLNSQLPH